MLYLERRCKKASSHCTLLLPMTFLLSSQLFCQKIVLLSCGPPRRWVHYPEHWRKSALIHPSTYLFFNNYLLLTIVVLSFTSVLDFLPELTTPKSPISYWSGLIWNHQQLSVCTVPLWFLEPYPTATGTRLACPLCLCLTDTTFNPELSAFKQMLNPFLLLKLISALFPSFRSKFLCNPTGQWINLITILNWWGKVIYPTNILRIYHVPGAVEASVEVSGELDACNSCLHRSYSQAEKMGKYIDN